MRVCECLYETGRPENASSVSWACSSKLGLTFSIRWEKCLFLFSSLQARSLRKTFTFVAIKAAAWEGKWQGKLVPAPPLSSILVYNESDRNKEQVNKGTETGLCRTLSQSLTPLDHFTIVPRINSNLKRLRPEISPARAACQFTGVEPCISICCHNGIDTWKISIENYKCVFK